VAHLSYAGCVCARGRAGCGGDRKVYGLKSHEAKLCVGCPRSVQGNKSFINSESLTSFTLDEIGLRSLYYSFIFMYLFVII
jgi:hypothetical protein